MPRPLLSMLTAPALILAACGGGGSDTDQITDIIKEGNANPSSVCDHLDTALMKQIGGKDGCEKAAKGQPKDVSTKINSLKVEGDKATAKVTDKSGSSTITFVKQDGDWKVSGSQ